MSTLAAQRVPVAQLYTAAQISYAGADYIVLEVLAQPIGGWVVVANAVEDPSSHPTRWSLVYANTDAHAELTHREVAPWVSR